MVCGDCEQEMTPFEVKDVELLGADEIVVTMRGVCCNSDCMRFAETKTVKIRGEIIWGEEEES